MNESQGDLKKIFGLHKIFFAKNDSCKVLEILVTLRKLKGISKDGVGCPPK